MKYKALCAFFYVPFIANCASGSALVEKGSDTTNSDYGSYMFVGDCINDVKINTSDESKGVGVEIAALVASNLIGAGIDALGNAITKAASDDVQKTLVSSNLTNIDQLFPYVSQKNQLEPYLVCIQIVRGLVKPSDQRTEETLSKKGAVPYTFSSLKISENVDDNNYPEKTFSSAAFEFSDVELFIEILPIFDSSFVSFVPLELQYNGASSGERNKRKPRDLAISIGFVSPDKELTDTSLKGRSINFGTIRIKNGATADISYMSEGNRLSTLRQSQWMPLSKSMIEAPITIASYIYESRKAGAFVKLLATAFTESKDEIKAKIQTELDTAIAKRTKSDEEEAKEDVVVEIAKLKSSNAILAKEESLREICGKADTPNASEVTLLEIDIYESKRIFNIDYSDDAYTVQLPTGSCDNYLP